MYFEWILNFDGRSKLDKYHQTKNPENFSKECIVNKDIIVQQNFNWTDSPQRLNNPQKIQLDYSLQKLNSKKICKLDPYEIWYVEQYYVLFMPLSYKSGNND